MTPLPNRESDWPNQGRTPQEWPHWVNSLLLMARQLRRDLGQKLAPLGISENGFLLLWQCAQRVDGASQSQLAAVLGVSPAQVSGQVDKLKTLGLLICHRPPNNRRTQVWRITAKGQEHLVRVENALKNVATEYIQPSLIQYLRRRQTVERPSSGSEAANLRIFSPDSNDEASAQEAPA